MSGAWYWTRLNLRRSLGSVVALVLVVAFGAGAAMSAAAGARRSASAGARLVDRSSPGDAFMVAADPATFDAMANSPGVVAATGLAQLGLQPRSVPCNDERSSYFPIVVPVAGRPFAVPRPRLVAGRFPDQGNPTEALLSEQHARRLDVGVGDPIRYLPYVIDEDGEIVGCGEEVVAEVEVVGIVREFSEIGASDEPTLAYTYLTEAFAAAHPDLPSPGSGVAGEVDLTPGADPQDFADDVERRAPDDEEGEPLAQAFVIPFSGDGVQPALDAGAIGLWAFAAVVSLLALTVLALALARQSEAIAPELRLLAVLGMSMRDRAVAAAGTGAIAVGVGLVLAVGVAAAGSTVHLVGLAKVVEPDPGFDLDPAVLAAGALALVVLGSAVVAAIALRAALVAGRPPSEMPQSRRPGVAERLASLGAPLWGALGAGYALGRRRRTTLPARSALLGVVVGTAGLVAVLLFGHGVGRAGADPGVYGWGSWDGWVGPDDESSGTEVDVDALVLDDRDVAAAAHVQIRFKLDIDGRTSNGIVIHNLRGRSGPTVVRGRLPVGPSEVALGTDTAEATGAGLGGAVTAGGPAGRERLEVVGIVAFPALDGSPLAAGWVADRAAVNALGWPAGCNDENECIQSTAVSWRDGVDGDEVVERLNRSGLDVDRPIPGAEVLLIAEADGLPGVAAGVVALVAVAGIAHTLTVTVRRRRRELAILRALGFDRTQVRRVLHAEGAVLGVVGGTLGAVAGLAIGRVAWRRAAGAIGIGPALSTPVGLVAAVLAGVVVVALMLSLVPARLAARATPARGLSDR